jgi:hypothetical protein
MSNNQAFVNAVKASNIPIKEKFNVVHDFLATTTDSFFLDALREYREELLKQINRNVMCEKHPAFANYFDKQ